MITDYILHTHTILVKYKQFRKYKSKYNVHWYSIEKHSFTFKIHFLPQKQELQKPQVSTATSISVLFAAKTPKGYLNKF